METADSRVSRAICTMIRKLIRGKDRIGPVFPKRVIRRWPAIILADKRIASVPGRITLLMDSMHTINGMSTGGVPWGTRWASIWVVLLIHPISINLIHKGRAIESVIVIWLVLVKI